MKKLLIILALICFGCKTQTPVPVAVTEVKKAAPAAKPKTAPKVVVIDKTITAATVKEVLSFLASDSLKGRDTGTPGIAEAASYIEGIFKKNRVIPYFNSYRDTLGNFDKPAFNVVGYIPGADEKLKDEFIVLGAHYDHIGYGKKVANDSIANGANDNASGTTAVLELSKYFGFANNNKRSIMFVTFTGEERGLLGSRHLAEKLKDQKFNLYAMINFEMIGVPLKRSSAVNEAAGANYSAYISGYELSNMADKMNEYAGKKLIGYLPKATEYQLFKRSDNYPFYDKFGKPAQTVCTFDFTNFEYYHHVDDEISQMDFTHMAGFINDMIPVIEKMANSPTREIQMNTVEKKEVEATEEQDNN